MASKSVSTRLSSCSDMTDYAGKGKEFMPSELPTQNSYTEGNIGNFLENNFLPHTPPQFCKWISFETHVYNWSCGHSARPLGLS